jgi:ribosomal protein L15E
MSDDGLNAGQVNKFVARFKMGNLRLENGYWVANDGDYPYIITAQKYWAALDQGDLN